MPLARPELTQTENGEERRVGFEFEFSGISLDASAEVLARLIQGEINRHNAFHYQLKHDDLGIFSVELDASMLKEEKYKDHLTELGVEADGIIEQEKLENILKEMAETVVPVEIVTPPLPLSAISLADDIVSTLRKADAEGSNASVLYAFGLHINTEIAVSTAQYLLNHMRAFTLLYDWICEKSGIDLTRRISGYIKEYPEDYRTLILDNAYSPDRQTLMNDYLELVGSRNYALDMLPCFAHIDELLTMQRAQEPDLIKARPAFHYRLGNCRIDEEDWSVSSEWQYWLAIEDLAGNTDRLAALIDAYWPKRYRDLLASKGKWVEFVDETLSG